jgi:hypothetical protein
MVKTIEKAASVEIVKDGYELTLDGISQWLRLKCLMGNNNSLLEYEDIDKWKRRGSETYSTVFRIKFLRNGKEQSKLINIKAIITLDPERGIRDWSKRREVLDKASIPVSHWYWFGDGIIIEDFYPNDYNACEEFSKLALIASQLDLLGFHTLNFLLDIRCDDDGNPFYIDFGSDLGSPSSNKSDTAITKLIEFFPKREIEIQRYLKTKEQENIEQ